ncbi:recombinase family protein [Nocardia sp. No.11]|uniref:recombinase family protein n=1 Tax=Nocardia sp. No.11 TaxID=3128861 RepID=UPI00319E10D1
MTAASIHAAVYLRQSLDREQNLLAIARQRGPCIDLCAARSWVPVEYVDNDTSATTGKRKAYTQMLADIEAGLIQAIVVWDLDRLYRRPIELEHLIDLADRYGLRLATVTGDVDLATDNGRLFARIKGAVARAEVERKSARQKAAALQRAQSGKRPVGQTLFGFTADDDPHPVHGPAVAGAYADVLAGISVRAICRGWVAAGYTTARGNLWTSPILSRALRNPRYAGLRAYNGEIVGKSEKPGLVDENTWWAVQTLLSDPARRPMNYGRRYLGTGLFRCGRCPDAPKIGTGTSGGYLAYKCRRCALSRNQPGFDDHILRLTAARLAQPDAAELLVSRDVDNVDEIRAQVTAHQARLDALAADFAEGELTSSQLRTATARLREKIDAAEAQILDAAQRRVFEGVIGAGDTLAALLGLSIDRQRAIVDALMEVTLHPGRHGGRGFHSDGIEIAWR